MLLAPLFFHLTLKRAKQQLCDLLTDQAGTHTRARAHTHSLMHTHTYARTLVLTYMHTHTHQVPCLWHLLNTQGEDFILQIVRLVTSP